MNLLKLQIVVLIEKYKKVTDVASELGLKQPTVSFHMKSLESELGVPLFQNRSGRVLLTEAGQALHPYALRIVALAADAERAVHKTAGRSRFSLRIGASAIPSLEMLPSLLTRLTAEHPDLEVTLQTTDNVDALLSQIRDRKLPLAIVHGLRTEDDLFLVTQLEEDEAVLACSPDHPFARQNELAPGQIAAEPVIQLGEGLALRTFSDRWAALNGIRLQSRVVADSSQAAGNMTEAGAGIAILSRMGTRREVEAGRLVVLSLPGRIPDSPGLFLVQRRDHVLTEAEQIVVNRLTAIRSGI
ncbi:LysR family transcriptional regulator [Paenibacillus sp. HN-1]|uniref:LysR family transcriptional regulator n=1 Tax=Paenibacillus TaxID=44249 RepID=UPI001CA9BCF7|nr:MULTISPECIES: LysR family transcriptional regulator [Paenibacillus]MBY9078501.1 LysR family transcriptional regulator [Paenibacillus sp. CGMCC 1.18879]MBY9082794.1 LysR family transcriptional regulator [Paenibacillus sinensis]